MNNTDEMVDMICKDESGIGFENYIKLTRHFLKMYPDNVFKRNSSSCIGHEFINKIKDALEVIEKIDDDENI